jgi:hypothetical protein
MRVTPDIHKETHGNNTEYQGICGFKSLSQDISSIIIISEPKTHNTLRTMRCYND